MFNVGVYQVAMCGLQRACLSPCYKYRCISGSKACLAECLHLIIIFNSHFTYSLNREKVTKSDHYNLTK